MKRLKFKAGWFPSGENGEEVSAEIAQEHFDGFIEELLRTMTSFTQGMSLIEEEEFRELFNDDYVRTDI